MTRANMIKEASQIPIGGSEDEAKQAVKNLFKATKNRYDKLSQSDCDELDRLNDLAEAQTVF